MLPKIDVVKREKLTTLQELLPQYISSLKVKNGYDEDSFKIVHTNWEKIVGKVIATKSIPLKIDKGTLVIQVTSKVWKTELMYSKKMLLTKIEELLNSKKVQNISLRG